MKELRHIAQTREQVLAWAIEKAERDYPGVEPLRKLEFEDLDRAICAALEQSIQFVKDSGKPVDPESQAALDDARRQLAQRGRQTANPNLCENHQEEPVE